MGKSVELKITEWVLSSLFDALVQPWLENYDSVKSKNSNLTKAYYNTAIYRLRRQGYLKLALKNGQKFLEITKHGQIRTLIFKATRQRQVKWDGKWRLVTFDIPEDFRNERNKLRKLLRTAGFFKLQASVFISPYQLNREAISYLKETGLVDYIRILRVDEIDYDKDLKKHFNLK